jgi:hypothetical protein
MISGSVQRMPGMSSAESGLQRRGMGRGEFERFLESIWPENATSACGNQTDLVIYNFFSSIEELFGIRNPWSDGVLD